jgi:hypothetical protein
VGAGGDRRGAAGGAAADRGDRRPHARGGVCPRGILADCAGPQERFADTFAKWALRGKMSLVGAGYSLAAPPSLEDWGAPLARLAVERAAAARTGSTG